MGRAGARGIWGKLGSSRGSTGDVWRQVDRQLTERPEIPRSPQLSIWKALQAHPGGMWRQLGDETIISTGDIDGIWSDALDMTLVMEVEPGGLWGEADDETLILSREDGPEVWREIGEETIILAPPTQNVWDEIRGIRDFSQKQPELRLGYAIKKFTGHKGEIYYILKNLRQRTYLRLTEQQQFLWKLMDGENTLQDIAVAYMTEYGVLAIDLLVNLLGQLEVGGFLTTQRTNVYGELRAKISGRGLGHWLVLINNAFLQKEFPIQGVDKFFTRTYNAGIKYLYTKPVQILFLILTLVGLGAFGLLATSGQYSLLQGGTAGYAQGIVALYVTRTIALFIHEGGHAYTCKHYGREIRKSGIMIYYGSFAFYVDTTDIWMESRIPRIMVSWGGPYTGFILGGAASIFALTSPWSMLNGFAYQFAFLTIFDSVFNLNPLLQWDGYYILMDLLEMPSLRKRALAFYQAGGLFRKLFRRERFSREERVWAIYGFLTAIWTIVFFASVLILFGESIIGFITEYIPLPLLSVVLVVLLLFLLRRQIYSLQRRIGRWRISRARRSG